MNRALIFSNIIIKRLKKNYSEFHKTIKKL